jgi:hypothetical protein
MQYSRASRTKHIGQDDENITAKTGWQGTRMMGHDSWERTAMTARTESKDRKVGGDSQYRQKERKDRTART